MLCDIKTICPFQPFVVLSCFSVATDERNARKHRCRTVSRVCSEILSYIVSVTELSIMGRGRPEQC